jgi:hypothetical protein
MLILINPLVAGLLILVYQLAVIFPRTFRRLLSTFLIMLLYFLLGNVIENWRPGLSHQ